jgi:DinB superfamily
MDYTARPAPTDFPAFYHGYVQEASGSDMLDAMRVAQRTLREVLARVRPEQEDHRYAPDKWSIKEVVQHVLDAERVFAYRALRFGRNDSTDLPGFEENDYAPASLADRRTLNDLASELDVVRDSTLRLFESLPPGALDRSGHANGRPITVRAIGWVIAGHSNHHARILLERYLNNA